MKSADALTFLEPAISPRSGNWADLGAGDGTFTRVLASLLDPESSILAVDSDPNKVAALRRLADRTRPPRRIVAVQGDVERAHEIPELAQLAPDGILLSNILHYFRDPVPPLRALRRLLNDRGRIVIIEYDRTSANRWVPYPVPRTRLAEITAAAKLHPPEIVSSRPSLYQGDMYCAVIGAQEVE